MTACHCNKSVVIKAGFSAVIRGREQSGNGTE
jgi:hypothetical protein